MAELSLQHDLKQTLEMLLSPRLLQTLKILNLSYIDLVEYINKEAEENPVLEVEQPDKYVEFIKYLTSDKNVRKEADLSELPGLENIDNAAKTLSEHLMEQLELEALDETYYQLAKQIIENIEDTGYLLRYPKVRETLMKQFSVSRPTVDKALKIVQSFEPDGVGARDLKECLLIQIREYNFENEALQEILTRTAEKHLDDLSSQAYNKIAQALGIPESGVGEIANFIKNNLNPRPGSSFGGTTRHVIPSFAVEPADQGFNLVNLETRYGPKISLSPHYLKMLENPKTDASTRAFIKSKLQIAKNLIEDFAKRSEISQKSVRKIIETQEDFLRHGVTGLRPLTQKSLADEFGVHPSTISRTVAEKYIQTPLGIFPIKLLCPRGPKGVTVGRIKIMLAEIIKNEDRGQPLTDQRLAGRMKERGVALDRRTVAYYRQELNIASSAERTSHG